VKLFITGGAGFIGSHFVRHVLEMSDHEVTVFDALTYAGRLENLESVRRDPRFRFVRGDTCDQRAVLEAMRGHDAVVHLAAESHVDRSLLDGSAFVRTNVLGTTAVCEAAVEVGVSRFLHVSTDEVYGSVETGTSLESDALRPRSPYSASKASSDLIVHSYHVSRDLPAVITRSSNVFGPNQFPEKMIPLFVTLALEGDRIPLYGDGLHVRDWLWIDDNCRALNLLLESGVAGQVYNVGAGNERTSLDVTRQLLALAGCSPALIDLVEDRPGHDRRYSISTDRIRSLGWVPLADFDAALEQVVRWYRDHPEWWRPLMPEVHALRLELADQRTAERSTSVAGLAR
jgi:dTDP-glucose 4,6-dehydratase